MTSGTTRTHLVWDWNGTLLDDTHAVIQATNAAFAEVELEPITLEQYREMYTIPIPRFYERFLGRLPTEAEWERMDGVFHRYYAEQRAACGLTDGVEELLHQWQRAGRSQSLLSMYGHEQLVPVVRGYGIEPRFVRVEGRTGPSGGSKALHMERHFAALAGAGGVDGFAPENAVVIGDALDDAVAAAHVGARAVLYTGGSHSRSSLEGAGVPVVDSLGEAVALAETFVA
ncbi:HAD family hydrolase [Streptomyces fimicarius]|uniref:HAD family hydrolase n=1 Tax=Streptomyces TaxID=1883 RepID=UPI0004AA6F67|nr:MULTISPECIES: HAD family hydrolase [Streptomyces]WSV21567.1 HAD hydrolase-like protein [Streptomyces fimicarius]MCL6290191.1 HAD hydrolase-like protein [Streptomyces sp. 43Y-GA-1]MDX2674192.1 HAD hydrolase-like protein [Streptomyces sp. NRRL_ISP-5395]MDX3343133.1 HAD hydrolase-like protein [Streptomyces sp. ME02-6979.5a]MDX3595872.1 HAD hydrolase-like protein [Streptomyces sp. ID03-2B]